MKQIFAVVPPMSKDIALSRPARAAMSRASSTPPAGPDSTSRTGWRRAVSTVVSPPPDVISSSGQPMPISASMPSRRAT